MKKKSMAVICVMIMTFFSFGYTISSAKPTKPPKKQKCASGIINPATNQCWICSNESRDDIRLRVEKAKTQTNKLAGCKPHMTVTQLEERQKWWQEFHEARVAENACWEPKHSSHETEAKKALASANNCEKLLNEKKGKK